MAVVRTVATGDAPQYNALEASERHPDFGSRGMQSTLKTLLLRERLTTTTEPKVGAD